MNGWSAHIVMNANNRFSWIQALAVLASFVAPSFAQAEEPTVQGPYSVYSQESAVQSLYGVKEILVRSVRFDDMTLAKTCRLTVEDLDATILQELKDNNLPATPEKDARPTMVENPRILLVPQIVPYNNQGLDCVTWVSLSAETKNHLRVLPIEVPRIVNVIYWRSGEIVASAVSVHADHVNVALHKMIHNLGQKYMLAQPPTVGRPNGLVPR